MYTRASLSGSFVSCSVEFEESAAYSVDLKKFTEKMDKNNKKPLEKLTNRVTTKKTKQLCITQWTVPAKVPAKNTEAFTSKSVKEKENFEPFTSSVNRTWWLHLPPPPKRSINGAIRKSYDLVEDRIMLTYLIDKGIILCGPSRGPWESMKKDGYFKDRTIESLNNHFRRKLLPKIEKYKLPKKLEEDFILCRDNYTSN